MFKILVFSNQMATSNFTWSGNFCHNKGVKIISQSFVFANKQLLIIRDNHVAFELQISFTLVCEMGDNALCKQHFRHGTAVHVVHF